MNISVATTRYSFQHILHTCDDLCRNLDPHINVTWFQLPGSPAFHRAFWKAGMGLGTRLLLATVASIRYFKYVNDNRTELELSRVHTPRATSASIWKLQEQHCSAFVDDLYLRMLGQLCAWAENTWPTVGMVDRCGQQKLTICYSRGPCHTEAIFRQFISCSDA